MGLSECAADCAAFLCSSYMRGVLASGIGVVLLSVGGSNLDQTLHSFSGGYEDASCIAKSGENRTNNYCRYQAKGGGCLQYSTCCDYRVMIYSERQPSTGVSSEMIMHARACSALSPCAAFYEWLKSDPTTSPRDESTIIFPCKYNTAKLDKNFDSSNYCGASRFVTFGPITAGEGWCGVVSSAAEFPSLLDADDYNQRLKPLWITLIIIGSISIILGCGCALRAAINFDIGAQTSEEEPASASGVSRAEASHRPHGSGDVSREETRTAQGHLDTHV
jgi:hypothetical protein